MVSRDFFVGSSHDKHIYQISYCKVILALGAEFSKQNWRKCQQELKFPLQTKMSDFLCLFRQESFFVALLTIDLPPKFLIAKIKWPGELDFQKQRRKANKNLKRFLFFLWFHAANRLGQLRAHGAQVLHGGGPHPIGGAGPEQHGDWLV